VVGVLYGKYSTIFTLIFHFKTILKQGSNKHQILNEDQGLDERRVVHQIVLPHCFQNRVISEAHDPLLGENLDIPQSINTFLWAQDETRCFSVL